MLNSILTWLNSRLSDQRVVTSPLLLGVTIGCILIIGVLSYQLNNAPAKASATTSVEASSPGSGWFASLFKRRYALLAGIAVLEVVLLAVVFWWGTRATLPAAAGHSIAVLPFENLDGDRQSAYFSDGMTVDITNELGKIADLTVISSGAALQYKGSKKSIAAIAEELKVSTVLTGSVRREGNRVRIVGQLIDPRTSAQLWSEDYDRKLTDVFAIQADVATQIAHKLKAKLTDTEKNHIDQVPTASLTAYDFYLKGLEYYRRTNKADNDRAIALFKQALAMDADYALAYAGLARAYSRKTIYFGEGLNWLEAALQTALKSVSLNPNLAEGHTALGNSYWDKGQVRRALESYRRAIAINPNYSPAVSSYGSALSNLGELSEAVRWTKKAIPLDPTNANPYHNLGLIYVTLAEDDTAIQWLQKALALQPDDTTALAVLSEIYLLQNKPDRAMAQAQKILKGDPESLDGLPAAGNVERFRRRWGAARQYYQKVLELTSGDFAASSNVLQPTTVLADIESKSGHAAAARSLLARSVKTDKERIAAGDETYYYPFDLAAVYTVRKDRAQALQWLRKAIAAGLRDYRGTASEPAFSSLRADPDFQILIQQMKRQVETMQKQLAASDS
ncbi:tetratricopeptide repeat protein [Gloeobacter kilaueensis]|uniref:tetratricopeptide repeat protein n=1 Tax=Gloeobacter kilaueensis TaxID=1416614 RepID=UPI00118226A0|nr:tetratricopeptide repeat protein [Gloeobacter kilaueensis]